MKNPYIAKVLIVVSLIVVSFPSWSEDPKCPSPLLTHLSCKGDLNSEVVKRSIVLVCKNADSKYSMLGGEQGQNVPPDAEVMPAEFTSTSTVDSYEVKVDKISVVLSVFTQSKADLNSEMKISVDGQLQDTQKFSCK